MKKYELKKFEKKSPIEVIFNLIDFKHSSVIGEGVVQHLNSFYTDEKEVESREQIRGVSYEQILRLCYF